jgi:uncharacterized protein YndB with AHSA1/START domain
MPNTVRLHRVLAAKPEKVYRAFIEADALAKWLPTCRDRFCLGPTDRAPWQGLLQRGAAQPAQPTTDPARPSCLKSCRF